MARQSHRDDWLSSPQGSGQGGDRCRVEGGTPQTEQKAKIRVSGRHSLTPLEGRRT